MSKVTVLMAVYNAASYLQKSIGSLRNQTLRDVQIVCIDDCSTDNSLAILNGYAAQDDRIKVIHLEKNSGQAHARNVGLEIADGEYVCMLDSDDWFSDDALEKAVEVFERHPKTDCVLFEVMLMYGDRQERYKMPDFECLSGEEALRLSLMKWEIHGLYMVRSELHKRYPYDETAKLCSDDNTTHIHYLLSREVRRCSGVYYYRQHEQSFTHAVGVRHFEQLKSDESMYRQLVEHGVDMELINQYVTHRWRNVIGMYMYYHFHKHQLTTEERSYGLGEIKRAWQTIDMEAVDKDLRRKFGHRHTGSWRMFRLQEWIYFTLRGMLGKKR